MSGKRKAGPTAAQANKAGSKPKSDPRAKRTYRLDDDVARRYEAHCIVKRFDKDKRLNEILTGYLGGSYWVDKADDIPGQAGPTGGTPIPPIGTGQAGAGGSS